MIAGGAVLDLCELFDSLAGEGQWSGRPAAFVRLARCNLRCRWCDTSYAWAPGQRVRRPALVGRIVKLGRPRAVITGGEPLLQPETPLLINELLERGLDVALETNGSLPIAGLPRATHVVMDLKPPSSGHADSNLWENLCALKRSDEIKVVIANRADFDWLLRELELRATHVRCGLSVQPAAGRLAGRRLAEWLLDSRLDARLSLQLHKLLWGAEPGR